MTREIGRDGYHSKIARIFEETDAHVFGNLDKPSQAVKSERLDTIRRLAFELLRSRRGSALLILIAVGGIALAHADWSNDSPEGQTDQIAAAQSAQTSDIFDITEPRGVDCKDRNAFIVGIREIQDGNPNRLEGERFDLDNSGRVDLADLNALGNIDWGNGLMADYSIICDGS